MLILLMDNVEVHVITVDGAGLKVGHLVQVKLTVDVLRVEEVVITTIMELNVPIIMMIYVVILVLIVVGVGLKVNPQVQVMLTVDVKLHNSLPSEKAIKYIEYN